MGLSLRRRGDERAPIGSPARSWLLLAAVLIAGFALRLPLMLRVGNVDDTMFFYHWASSAAARGVAHVYKREPLAIVMPLNYPPCYVHVLALLPRLHDAVFSGPAWASPEVRFGLRREAARGSYRQLAAQVEEAGAAGQPLDDATRRQSAQVFRWLGLEAEYRTADPATFGALLALAGRTVEAPVHLGPQHRSVLFILKLPAVLGDLAIALVAAAFAARVAGRGAGVAAAAAVFLNPVVIHNSAFWGQLDALPTALVVGAVLALIGRRWWLVAVLAVAGVLTKLQTVVVAPVIVAVLLADLARRDARARGAERTTARSLAGAAAAGALAALLPLATFIRAGTLGAIVDVYRGLTRAYPLLSVRAFNLWWLFTSGDATLPLAAYPRDDAATIVGLTPKTIGLVLLVAALGLVVAAVVRWRGERDAVLLGSLAVAMSFFCLPTEIHERYGYPIVPLAILVAVVLGRRYAIVAAVASLTHFANLVLAGQADGAGAGGGLLGSLAASAVVTYGIAVANLALFAMVLRDLHRRGRASAAASGRRAAGA